MRTTRMIVVVVLASARVDAQPNPLPGPGSAPAAASRPADDPTSVAAASPEAAKPWQLGVQPLLGVVVPTSKLGPMVIGAVELDVVLPPLEHRLVLGLDVSLTRPGHDGSVMDPRIPVTADYMIHETELAVALLATYRFASQQAAMVPWAGLGPMLQMLKTTETTTIAPGENTAVSSEIGFEFGGGVDYRVGPGFVTGDLREAYSKLDHTLTCSTNAGKLTLAAGYRVVF